MITGTLSRRAVGKDVRHIVARYARSLDDRKYDVLAHPAFDDYARGLMASEFAPDFIKKKEELQKRFPPRHLNGLGPGLQWLPPKQHAEAMASVRRSRLPPKEYAEAIASLRQSQAHAA
jgi:hypothetical protein